MCAAYCILQLLTHKLKLGNTPRRLLVAVTMASLFVTGILLSLGQFTPRDFFLLLSFTLIGTFYIQRMWDTKR